MSNFWGADQFLQVTSTSLDYLLKYAQLSPDVSESSHGDADLTGDFSAEGFGQSPTECSFAGE